MQTKPTNQEMMKKLMEALSNKDLGLFTEIMGLWENVNRPEVVKISDEEKHKADKFGK